MKVVLKESSAVQYSETIYLANQVSLMYSGESIPSEEWAMF